MLVLEYIGIEILPTLTTSKGWLDLTLLGLDRSVFMPTLSRLCPVLSRHIYKVTNKIWWRRRELNPRPKPTYQPRLHAYSGQGFLLCDTVRTQVALPSPHDKISADSARSPPSTMPAVAFLHRSRCPVVNVVALRPRELVLGLSCFVFDAND